MHQLGSEHVSLKRQGVIEVSKTNTVALVLRTQNPHADGRLAEPSEIAPFFPGTHVVSVERGGFLVPQYQA